ncbi:MAG: hypothetical protein Q4A33_01955 [Candidatus Saccharibacteria bacterium]|nr:hypothetical protein [Candidatus Saccharibacteria bacterium]
MRKKPSTRVARSRDSLYLALAAMVSEDDYNLSIQTTELCARANKGRTTFFRQYRQVGDIFKLKDEELLVSFNKIDFTELSQKILWRQILLFIAKNREIFIFKFRYDRDRVFRKMIVGLRDEIAPVLKEYEPEVADKLFEILYFEVRGIIKLWVRKGAKAENINRVAKYLAHAANNISKNWGDIFTT